MTAPAKSERETLLARWLDLTRVVLPGMAQAARWPIRIDHCFMRVCLDAAMGEPWHHVIARPAVRHLTTDQLGRAVAVAERLRGQPACLFEMNRQSLGWRGKEGQGSALTRQGTVVPWNPDKRVLRASP